MKTKLFVYQLFAFVLVAAMVLAACGAPAATNTEAPPAATAPPAQAGPVNMNFVTWSYGVETIADNIKKFPGSESEYHRQPQGLLLARLSRYDGRSVRFGR